MFSAFALAAVASARCDVRPQLQFLATISRATIARRGSSFEASARVTLTIHSAGHVAISSDPGMRAHAAGYYEIARKLAQRSDVRAIGATVAEARARLARAATTMAHDANLDYKREAHIYDVVTAGGKDQSQGPSSGFPGGPNANVYCGK